MRRIEGDVQDSGFLDSATLRGARIGVCLLCCVWAGCAASGPREASTSSTASTQALTAPPRVDRAEEIQRALEGIDWHGGRAQVGSVGRALAADEQRSEAALLALAGQAQRAGRLREALRFHARAFRLRPGSRAASLGLGRTLRLLGRGGSALAVHRASLDRGWRDPASLHELALAAQGVGRFDEAESAWRQAAVLAPAEPMYPARLAALASLRGQSEAASSWREAALRLAETPLGLPSGAPSWSSTGAQGDPSRTAARWAKASGSGLPARVRLDSNGGTSQAAEVSGVGHGDTFAVAWVDQREGASDGTVRVVAAISADRGASWTEQILRPNLPPASGQEADPMTAADPRTGDLWVGGLHLGQSQLYVARKAFGSPGLMPPIRAFDGFADKPFLAAGRGPNDPSTTRLYLASAVGVQRSTDLGQTWSPAVGYSIDIQVGSLPRIGPDGTLYVATWDAMSGANLVVWRSADGGQTLQAPVTAAVLQDPGTFGDSPRIAGSFRAPNNPAFAVDERNGTLYLAYHDTTSIAGGEADVDVYLTRSTDGGGTWTTPVVLNGDGAPAGDQFLPWLEVDASGRLHAVYFDTRHAPRPDVSTNAQVDVTYATSEDGGTTWTEVRLTPSSFASTDAVWTGGGIGQFLGDYLGIALGRDTALVLYPDAAAGDLDIYAQPIPLDLFADGFESGGLTAWSGSVP